MVYFPLSILSLVLAPSHAVVVQQAVREHDAPEEANVQAGLDNAEEILEDEDAEMEEVIVQGYNQKDWENYDDPFGKKKTKDSIFGVHPKGSHPLFGKPKKEAEDPAERAKKVAEAAQAQAEQAKIDAQAAQDAWDVLPWYEKEAMEAREASLSEPGAKPAARRAAGTKPKHPGDALTGYEKRFLHPRCNALELTRIHRNIATDISSFFGNNDQGGVHWPDMTGKGEFPNCTQRNLMPPRSINSAALAMCFSAKSRLGVHCHSCLAEFAYRALNRDAFRAGGSGKNKPPAGCYLMCSKSVTVCSKSMTDITGMEDCFNNPDLKRCFNCLKDPLDKLADCVGDKTPMNPATLANMVVEAMEEHKPASIGVLNYVKQIGIQALVEEYKMKEHNTTDPRGKEAAPSFAPQIDEIVKQEAEKQANEKEEEAQADDLFR